MKRFTSLYTAIDRTTRTSEKLALMETYFRETPPADAAWGLFFLSGERIKRLVPRKLLRQWALEAAHIPDWLMEECYSAVGDFAELVALLLPDHTQGTQQSLHALIEKQLLPMASLPEESRRAQLLSLWNELSTEERLVWNKIITGEFRVGVSKVLVLRALAKVIGISPGVMAHRLMGDWTPSAENYARLMSAKTHATDLSRPYPFFLAYPLESTLEELGPPSQWQAEWKWDGIRGQLIRRDEVALWSRGEDLITDRFPEIQESARFLPNGTVLDGEVLGWQDGRPLPFGHLQQRIGRKRVSEAIRKSVPAVFMTYDLMEADGLDLRSQPLTERRARLEALMKSLPPNTAFKLSETLPHSSWADLQKRFTEARSLGVEGLMLKRVDSPYRVGRVKGDWWKWKVDPHHMDAVLIYAQAGHGRRASLYTDYTFGVWDQGKLVPVAKAYSGLTDNEIRQVDTFIRNHTLERFGPVRTVKPELVFELAFEGIQKSPRHKSGVAVRFPRMSRWRQDKKANEADTLETVRALIA